MATSRRIAAALLFAAVTLGGSSPATAQEAPEVAISGDGVELNFQNAEISVVLTALAELSGLSLMHGNLPDVRVTLRTGAPVDRAELRGYLENLATANDLTLETDGSLVRVSALAQDDRRAREHAEEGEASIPQLYVYRLRHAQAAQIAGTLGSIFGGPGGMAGGPALSRRGLSGDLREQRVGAGAPADAGGAAEGNVTALPGALEGSVRIVPDAPTNSLLVHASSADYAIVEAAIEELDSRPLQVLIEVLIAEVRRDRTRAVGVGAEVIELAGKTIVAGSLVGLSTGDVALRVLRDGDISVDAVLSAIAQTSDISVVSRPVVIAQNNEEARILVGTQQPFVQLSRSLPTDAAVRDQVVQYRDVGTQLTIRPTINPDGYVSLTVLQEVSTATSEIQFDAPVIGTREAATRLLVKDGHTAVLGGLVENGREWSRTGIPILKDIPLLGGFFGSTRSMDTSTELILFLTPHVLRNDEALDAASDRARSVTPGLERALPDTIPLFSPDFTTP
jgi:general secretion pathway protein D